MNVDNRFYQIEVTHGENRAWPERHLSVHTQGRGLKISTKEGLRSLRRLSDRINSILEQEEANQS